MLVTSLTGCALCALFCERFGRVEILEVLEKIEQSGSNATDAFKRLSVLHCFLFIDSYCVIVFCFVFSSYMRFNVFSLFARYMLISDILFCIDLLSFIIFHIYD